MQQLIFFFGFSTDPCSEIIYNLKSAKRNRRATCSCCCANRNEVPSFLQSFISIPSPNIVSWNLKYRNTSCHSVHVQAERFILSSASIPLPSANIFIASTLSIVHSSTSSSKCQRENLIRKLLVSLWIRAQEDIGRQEEEEDYVENRFRSGQPQVM